MRNLFVIVAFIFGTALAFEGNAQMSKKERKIWKKKLKKVTPEQYKQLLDNSKMSSSQISSLTSEVKKLKASASEKDSQIETYEGQLKDLRNELVKAKSKPKTIVKKTGIDASKGVVFKVQIGAFKQKDLSEYKGSSKNFNSESQDDLNKYTIGIFRDYWKADTFKKELRSMGVRGAWVVSYKDGSRVPMKEVLENVRKK